jgi:hypothetical protein
LEQIRPTAFLWDVQVLNDLFGVDPVGRELHSISGQPAQEALAAFVDKRDFIQVDGARSLSLFLVVSLPACPQFSNPGPNETAL